MTQGNGPSANSKATEWTLREALAELEAQRTLTPLTGTWTTGYSGSAEVEFAGLDAGESYALHRLALAGDDDGGSGSTAVDAYLFSETGETPGASQHELLAQSAIAIAGGAYQDNLVLLAPVVFVADVAGKLYGKFIPDSNTITGAATAYLTKMLA